MNAFSNFDTGGGSEGPWLQMVRAERRDGEIPAKSFLIRDSDGKTKFDGLPETASFSTSKPCRPDGAIRAAPPERRRLAHEQVGCAFRAGPGDEFSAASRCAAPSAAARRHPGIRPGPPRGTRSGSRSGAAATACAGQASSGQDDGTRAQQFKRGSTVEPVLEVIDWVDRPDCLRTAPLPASIPARSKARPAAKARPDPGRRAVLTLHQWTTACPHGAGITITDAAGTAC